MILPHLAQFLHHEPLTNDDDRRKLWRLAAVLALAILAWLALFGPASAAEDDGGSMYRADHVGDATNMIAGPQRLARPLADSRVIGARPPECRITIKGRLIPFCGCALSVKIFGRVVNTPNLKLAAEWKRAFPRTRPAPGMVAARSGHAFQLVSHIKGHHWIVWDPNSGGGMIRLHARSIRPYTIVDPHGTRLALAVRR